MLFQLKSATYEWTWRTSSDNYGHEIKKCPVIISTVGPRSGPKVEFRQHTSTHVLRALKRTTFCQGMQLKKYSHFGTGTSFQNPRSYQNVWYPAF